MFLYPHPVYPRTSWERLFKQGYNLALVLNFAAFIISFTDFFKRLDNTYVNYWRGERFELTRPLQELLTNCSYNASITINGLTADSVMTQESLPFPFMFVTSLIVGIFCLDGLLIATDFIVKAFYAINVRNLRYRGLYVRVNIIMLVFVFVYTIAVIVAIAASANVRAVQQDFINACANRYMTLFPEKYIGTELDLDVVFGTNLVWILAGVVVNASVYLLAAVHLVGYSCRASTGQLVAEKHPWEKGVLCRPDKPLLLEWLRLRRYKEDLIREGRYDPRAPPVLPPMPLGPDDDLEFGPADAAAGGSGGMYDTAVDYGDTGGDDGGIVDGGEPVEAVDFDALEDPKKRRRHKHRRSRHGGGDRVDEPNGGAAEPGDDERRRRRRSRQDAADAGGVQEGDVIVEVR